MLRRLWSGFRWVIAGFVVLFLFRLGYGYAYPNGDGLLEAGSLREFTFARKNYASEKKMAAASMSVDQKYEKVASLSAHSDEYSEDERRLRALVPKHKALLQFEQSAGLSGRRTLDVAIGVPPAAFDAMVLDLRRIGRLQAIRVDKSDKTNEYRELQARRVSIEKTRDSLAKLRAAGGGRIEELLQLENRLLEIETQIQETGVRLGDFDSENEFCTVKFSLSEAGARTISLLTRLKVAFEWTAKYSALLMFVAAMGMAAVWMILLVVDRIGATRGSVSA
jgi:hypothetical protein